MSEMHDEEEKAEAQVYVLWCEGRLEELREAGLVEGQSALTESGREEYRRLVASGFVPSHEKVIWTLQWDQRVPPELVVQLAELMLRKEA